MRFRLYFHLGLPFRGIVALVALVLGCSLVGPSPARAQSTATLSGRVVDSTGAAVAAATVTAINEGTALQRQTRTNDEGLFVLPLMAPGTYALTIVSGGFAPYALKAVWLNVGDQIGLAIRLKIANVGESVVVTGTSSRVQLSPGTGTVVDRAFLENMPLSGRSLQELILLTPGVISGMAAMPGEAGEFSVNGQRTESNYFMVDGVSANFGPAPRTPLAIGTTGSLPAATALGTTQALVSVDALQEFRVNTSTYAAEYGRNPGGQFSFTTRAGTNRFHGSLATYVRRDAFEANDWFNNRYGLARPPLRQDHVAGALGGPLVVPGLYDGRSRTQFFVAYEHLRLTQRGSAAVTYVPTRELREAVPEVLRPLLDAYPLPTGPDVGGILAPYVYTPRMPSQIDTTSVRLDQQLGSQHRLFARSSFTPSSMDIDNVMHEETRLTPQTHTVGLTSVLSSRVTNDLRVNYSRADASAVTDIAPASGAAPADFAAVFSGAAFGRTASGTGAFGSAAYSASRDFELMLALGQESAMILQGYAPQLQRQWNVTDALSFVAGRHELKAGIDYRRLSPRIFGASEGIVEFSTLGDLLAGNITYGEASIAVPRQPIFQNFSAFVQDHWRTSPRLSLSLGVRWEVNPAPGEANGQLPDTVIGADHLATMTLAPHGARLYATTWNNLAPRLGVAYVLNEAPDRELVLHGGAGIFFDTAQQGGYFGMAGLNDQNTVEFGSAIGTPASFPGAFRTIDVEPPTPAPPYPAMLSFTGLQLPYTAQTSLSVQQALGPAQSVMASYIGAFGRRLLATRMLEVERFNPAFTSVTIVDNEGSSDYHALQLQYQRRLSHGLSALASYTWSHAIDDASRDLFTNLPRQRGNADFDVRHSLSAAVSLAAPPSRQPGWRGTLLSNWSLDTRFTARTAYPLMTPATDRLPDASGVVSLVGVDLVPGQPLYLYDARYPGGKAINTAAFATPAPNQAGNAPRNFLRGFGLVQQDLAVRRELPLVPGVRLQLRAEIFNVFNHPNFGTVQIAVQSPTGGLATSMLASSLSPLSPLYQLGGPRTMQFAAKVVF